MGFIVVRCGTLPSCDGWLLQQSQMDCTFQYFQMCLLTLTVRDPDRKMCIQQEEVFKRREEGLKRKDLELQDSLIRFSKFLQENDSKRSRAEKKAADEIKSRLQKEKEIDALQGTLEGLRTEKDKVHEILEKNMR